MGGCRVPQSPPTVLRNPTSGTLVDFSGIKGVGHCPTKPASHTFVWCWFQIQQRRRNQLKRAMSETLGSSPMSCGQTTCQWGKHGLGGTLFFWSSQIPKVYLWKLTSCTIKRLLLLWSWLGLSLREGNKLRHCCGGGMTESLQMYPTLTRLVKKKSTDQLYRSI